MIEMQIEYGAAYTLRNIETKQYLTKLDLKTTGLLIKVVVNFYWQNSFGFIKVRVKYKSTTGK